MPFNDEFLAELKIVVETWQRGDRMPQKFVQPQVVAHLALDLLAASARSAELEAVVEADRTLVADVATDLKAKLTGWHWLTEGRGSYEWDDDRYRQEFTTAALSFLDAIRPLEKLAADWSSSPKSAKEVADARIDLKARISELEKMAWKPIKGAKFDPKLHYLAWLDQRGTAIQLRGEHIIMATDPSTPLHLQLDITYYSNLPTCQDAALARLEGKDA